MSGKPAARVGDAVSDGVIVSGSSTVLIGDAAEGKADQCPTCEPAVGAPVNPILGAKLLPAETDFALAAPRPFAFTRSYLSSDTRVGCLGQGWTIPGEGLGLEADETRTVLIDAQGRRIGFGPLAPGEARFSPSERLWVRRGGLGDWAGRWALVPEDKRQDPAAIFVLAGRDGLQFEPRAGRLRLTAQLDRNGYRTDYGWSERGQLSRIRDSAGRLYQLVYHRRLEARPGDCGLRLSGVALLAPAGHDGAPPHFDPDHPDTDWLVRYDYDDAGNLAAVVDRAGETVRTFRWRNHLLVAHGAPGGIEVSYEWDDYGPHGKVLAQREANGLDRAYRYHADHTEVTDSLGRTERYHFEGEGGDRRWTVHERADGSRIAYRYDWAGRRVAVTDPLGRTRRTRLDGEGRTIGTAGPDGAHTALDLDPDTGAVRAATDAAGRRWRFMHDARGNVLAATGPDSAVTAYAYEDPGLPDRPTRITDPAGHVKTLVWSRLGQLVAYTDCSGKTSTWHYDAEGRLLRATDALGQTTEHTWDRASRLVAIKGPDGAITRYRYDGLGQVVATEDPLGQATRFSRDRFGRLTGILDPAGRTLRFRHDAAGRLALLENENEAKTRFAYDALDRLVEETGFDGRTRRYHYNAAGELVEIEEADGRVTRLERDLAGRLTARHLPATEHSPALTERFHWDRGGALVGAANPAAQASFLHDPVGRPIGEVLAATGAPVWTVSHKRNALGVLESTQYGDAPPIDWLTYGSGHLHGIEMGELTLALERDALHRETLRQWQVPGADPIEIRSAYTSAGVLAQREAAGAAFAWTRRHAYDPAGRLTAFEDDRHGAVTYQYDPAGRLVGSRHGATAHAYRFDPAGNRLASPGAEPAQRDPAAWAEQVRARLGDPDFNVLGEAGAGRSAAPARWPDNRVTEFDGIRYRYDPVGNLIEKRLPDGTQLALGYDGAHRLVRLVRRASDGAATEARYVYDPLGRRVAKTVTGPDGQPRTTHYSWDGDRLVMERTTERTRTWVYGPAGFVPMACVEAPTVEEPAEVGQLRKLFAESGLEMPVLEPRTGPAPAYFLYCTDHLGTPTALLDAAGKPRWQAEPDDWRAVAGEHGEVEQPIRFQGQFHDTESGLYYNHHRYYDPDVGRYVTQDPIGLEGGVNSYVYAESMPISRIDPFGLVDIYVGGAADNTTGIVKNWVATNAPDAKYYQWTQSDEIQSFIKSLPADEPVNLIGHSYGGDTAAWAALNCGRPVNSLTTVDPVSRFKPDYEKLKSSVGTWTNINASPTNSDYTDAIAALGGKWGEGPKNSATTFINVDANHGNFAGLIGAVR